MDKGRLKRNNLPMLERLCHRLEAVKKVLVFLRSANDNGYIYASSGPVHFRNCFRDRWGREQKERGKEWHSRHSLKICSKDGKSKMSEGEKSTSGKSITYYILVLLGHEM